MKLSPNDVYSKIEQLSRDAKSKLLGQGVVVPIKGKDGTIKVGHYLIKRKKDGFYCILDFEKEIKELFTLPKNIWFPFKKNITTESV